MVIVVLGAATSPELATVTVGVPDWPVTMVFGPVVMPPRFTVPEHTDSATTTVPLATTLRPLCSVRSRPRTV